MEQYALRPRTASRGVHDWPFNPRGHFLFARRTRCEMQRDDATTTKRETNEPADARPLYLITPINPHDSSRKLPVSSLRVFVSPFPMALFRGVIENAGHR